MIKDERKGTGIFLSPWNPRAGHREGERDVETCHLERQESTGSGAEWPGFESLVYHLGAVQVT